MKWDQQTQNLAQHYRISQDEYKRMCDLLGREPRAIEWPLFSALWSEHCSYKSSKVHLRKFSYRNIRIAASEGENAGIIHLGKDESIAFKMESHNHPSFIEPYQGAATGVGGILRDIFTMGARPIALADYLCFGEITADRMRTLVDGVVKGISGYGNCVGVPTITGQTNFHSNYNKNILVNAMAVGLLTKDQPVALSSAKGVGNSVVYVGAKTGKDGVHGASMASESFDLKMEKKKPNVQIGDPFYEKLLIEACLEVLQKNLVVAMQDMGAAGLTSSSFEMSSKGGVGLDICLDQVPMRQSDMTPEEILLSESQERMLLICEPQKLQELTQTFKKWGLDACVIGKVQAERKVKLFWKSELLTEIDPDLLVENAPRYERKYNAWNPINKVKELKTLETQNLMSSMNRMLQDFQFSSRRWIYRQYDQRVGARTAKDASQSVAFVKLPSQRGLAVSVGCRPELMNMDAQIGAFDAIAFPALKMASKGAQIQAVTDCLNFGNPEKPEIMTEFVTSVESLSRAAEVFDAPVISGNVSFYNETLNKNITSTPATGMIGLRESVENIPADVFQKEQQLVYLLKCQQVEAYFTQFEKLGMQNQFVGEVNIQKLKAFADLLIELNQKVQLSTSKVVEAGGLLYNLLLMSQGHVGVNIQEFFKKTQTNLLKENLYEVVVAIDPSQKDLFLQLVGQKFECHLLGQTQQGSTTWDAQNNIQCDEIYVTRQKTWNEGMQL